MLKGKESVFLERKSPSGTRDASGNLVSIVSHVEIKNCLVQWGSVTTTTDPAVTVRNVDAVVFAPRGTVANDNDVVIIRGDRYVLQGKAQVWDVPYGFKRLKPGVVLECNRQESA
jgi:hypothetical protein